MLGGQRAGDDACLGGDAAPMTQGRDIHESTGEDTWGVQEEQQAGMDCNTSWDGRYSFEYCGVFEGGEGGSTV